MELEPERQLETDSGAARRVARRRRVHAVMEVGTFPAVLGGAMLLAFYGIDQGVDRSVLVGALCAATAVLLLVIEQVRPFRDDWNRPRNDRRADFTYIVLQTGFFLLLARSAAFAGAFGVLHAVNAWLAQHAFGGWPSDWPLGVQLVLALLASELTNYWRHRLQHERPLLWRAHAVHHSAERVYTLNVARFHPVDIALAYVATHGVLILLGAGEDVLALIAVLTVVHGLLQHSNIDLRLGPLHWIFSTADLHRWHHSSDDAEAKCNYGLNIILWDIVFRTRYLPRDREAPRAVGLSEPRTFPTGFLRQLVVPFRWRSLQRDTGS